MNNHLLKMITNLISTFDEHKSQPPEEMVMHALVQLNSADHKDAPTPPQGTPGYGQMVAALVDTIKKEVDEQKPADRWQAFLEKFREHRNKLEEQTGETSRKLIALEEEEKTKITSEDVHEGFSVGHINKEKAAPPKQKSVTQKVQAVEQLNNPSSSKPSSGCQSVSSGTEADIDETPGDEDEDDEHIKPTALGREFAKIKIGEYYRCMQYISENPSVVAEKETDGLLIYAFNSQMAGKDEFAKQSVHQALLLQYCRQLGRDGVSLFFKR
jgi:cell division cycle protein 37